MKEIEVGDFIIWETMAQCSWGLAFEHGQVIDAVENVFVVRTGGMVRIVDPDNRDILFVGNVKDTLAMLARVKAMQEERNKAIRIADQIKVEVAGRHAGRIRKLFKPKRGK